MEAGKFSFKFSRQTQKNLVGSMPTLVSLNMLGHQQWLILHVEKDQQVLQLDKTITKRNHPEIMLSKNK
jgi:hypothetical protein